LPLPSADTSARFMAPMSEPGLGSAAGGPRSLPYKASPPWRFPPKYRSIVPLPVAGFGSRNPTWRSSRRPRGGPRYIRLLILKQLHTPFRVAAYGRIALRL
jgi:hypothetical protein